MIQIRSIHIKYKRFQNYVSKCFNSIKFQLWGIKHGKHLCVHGHVGLYIAPSAQVIIGDNYYISSGLHINPLARNLEASIKVNDKGCLLIGNKVGMSSPVIWVHQSVTIGNHVQIGAGTLIMDSDAHSLHYLKRRDLKIDLNCKHNAPIVIEDDVLIGANCIILKGVTIGARSVIGAGSVVVKNIPADSIAAGNPARVIKQSYKNSQ